MFSTILALMFMTTNPMCLDKDKDKDYGFLDYSFRIYKDEAPDLFISVITPNIEQFFKETKKAIESGEDIQPFIDRVEKESEIPIKKENVENLPLRKPAYRVMLLQSIRAGNYDAFKKLAYLCRMNEVLPVFNSLGLIAIYDRPYKYLNYILNYIDSKHSFGPGLPQLLMCNNIKFLWETLEAMPKGVWIRVMGIDSASTYVLPFNDLRLIKKLMTESIMFMRTFGLNYEQEYGRDRLKTDKDGNKSVSPIYSALSGILLPTVHEFGAAYKGATIEILKHLIEAGAKITPETLDGKSPHALVEKSCRTPKEKKEVIKYLKSIGVKDFGSKDVEQVKCKTDISEKGVYIYIDDKYSSK
jgi:hypothetical protein